MHVVEVIPLTNLPPQVPQLLSYFFNRPLLKGAVVEILINHRKTAAVVVSSSPIEDSKISLKKSGFQLKKLSSVIEEEPQLTDIQFKTALWLSRNYNAPLGLSFKTILPSFFGNKNYPFTYKEPGTTEGEIPKPLILLSSSKKLIENIKPEIEKNIRRKKQVLIIVPEISITKYFYEILAGYHEAAVLNSKLGIKQLYKEWSRISSGDAEVIIGTRQALFAPFADLGLIVMEDPANEAYKSDMTPKYNTRDVVLKVGELHSAGVIFVSRIPDIENYFISGNGGYNLKNKINPVKPESKVIDMLEEARGGNFFLFSRELKSSIAEAVKENKKVLIFSSRKGYFGSLVCQNCSYYFKCPQCSVALRLYKSPELNLVCHRCVLTQKYPQYCPNCQSQALKAAGFAGSERLKEELEQLLGNQIKKDIFMLDSASVKTPAAESELIEKMSESPSHICIATQAVFSHRFGLNFDLIGIPSLDSLTTVPDFKVEEGLFGQYEKLLDFEPKKIILQTFDSEKSILNLLTAGNYAEFYEKELTSRKIFFYPPFARLIKLSFSSPDKNKAVYESRVLNEKLKMAIAQRKMDNMKILGPSPAFIEKNKKSYVYNLVIKAPSGYKLQEILKFVPSGWSIDVDPRSIL